VNTQVRNINNASVNMQNLLGTRLANWELFFLQSSLHIK